MWRVLIDTNVWIDISSNYKEQVLLDVLEDLTRRNFVQLIVPRVVVAEFAAHRKDTIERGAHRTSSVLASARMAIRAVSDSKENQQLRTLLQEVGQKASLAGEAAKTAVMRVERLFGDSAIIELTNDVKLRAAERAIHGRGPRHAGRNSIKDAIIVETYGEVRKKNEKAVRYAFVSKNHKDFSIPGGNQKEPHPDIADLFVARESKFAKSLYFIDLVEALGVIAPQELAEANYVASGFPEPRTLSEIGQATDLLTEQVWYNRHKVFEEKIGDGRIAVVQGAYDYRDQSKVGAGVWADARAAAKRLEEKRGVEQLGPWSDFEWGMINGKLSALRWVLGDEWDFLDT